MQPDRGWAWLIMWGSFVNLMTTFIFIRSMSIFFLVFLDKFQQSATLTTLSFSLHTIFFSIGSIIVPVFLLPRFSVRLVSLVGSVLVCTSMLAMSFAPSMTFIHLGFSVLGLAYPLIFISQITLLGVYFKQKLSFASAFSNLGISIATMAGPALTQVLLDSYGLQGALLIHSGLNLHTIVACLLFRPPPPPSSKMAAEGDGSVGSSSSNSEQQRDLLIVYNDQNCTTIDSEDSGSVLVKQSISKDSPIIIKSNNKKPRTCGEVLNKSASSEPDKLTTYGKLISNRCYDKSDLDSTAFWKSDERFDSKALRKKDFPEIHHASLTLLPGRGKSHSFRSDNGVIRRTSGFHSHDMDCHEIAMSSDTDNNSPEGGQYNMSQDMAEPYYSPLAKLLRYIRNSPMSNPITWLLIMAPGIGINTQCGAAYMPSLGAEQGMRRSDLPYLMMAIGASDLFKLVIGYAADKEILSRSHMVCVTQLILGVTFNLAGLCQGLVPMMLLSVVFGATTESFHVLLPGITVDLVGVAYLGHVMSGYFLVNGAVMAGTHILVGLLKDNTGSYVGAYHFIGCLVLAGMVLLFIEPLVRRCSGRTKPNSSTS